MIKERCHIRVEGRVQGVCFRYYTTREAQRRGLTGWVRNQPDGSVELVAEGDPPALCALRDWCRTGPPGARVTGISDTFGKATGAFETFEVRY